MTNLRILENAEGSEGHRRSEAEGLWRWYAYKNIPEERALSLAEARNVSVAAF